MRVAYRDLVLGIAAVLSDPRTAAGGAPALDRLLHLGQFALGATGMVLTEISAAGSRVVAAVGSSAWALGRPVSAATIGSAVRDGDPVYLMRLAQLGGFGMVQFAEPARQRVLIHRIDVRDRTVALIGAMLPTEQDGPDEATDETVDPDQRAALRLLGATVAHLYAECAGLPIQQVDAELGRADRELFIAVTSHELRTPVAVIKGYADTLRDHWDSLDEPGRRDAARVIGQRADELARLVDRLLAASTGSAAVSVFPFDLLEALRRAVSGLPAYLRQRLEVRLPHRLPRAMGDRAGVATVVTELVTNAHKYSPGDEPVQLTAGVDRASVFFQVADRGIGISAENAHLAFERFWQGDSGDRRRYGGAGLGLYLVRKTIERQNGWVSLRPRDGGGTVAEVRLPRGDVAAQVTV